MKHSFAFEAYSQHAQLENGVTMQEPVEGTVHRGKVITSNGKNPMPYSKDVVDRGEFLYRNYCQVCHGKAGDGDGPIIPKFPNPPSLTSRRVMKLSSQELYDVISKGKGDMPSHAGQVGEMDRWKLIHYIEKLQGKEKQEAP